MDSSISSEKEWEVCNKKMKNIKQYLRLDFLEIYFSWNYKHTCGDNSNVRSI